MAADSKVPIPAQPPFSRAYASGDSSAHAPSGGLGHFKSLASSRSASGSHVSAVARHFPSSAVLLAGLLSEALRKAGSPALLPAAAAAQAEAAQAAAAAQAASPSSSRSSSSSSSSVYDPSLSSLAQELSSCGLAEAYRLPLLRSLARRLATDAAWPAEAHAFPAVRELLASGELAKALSDKDKAVSSAAAAGGAAAGVAAAGVAAAGAAAGSTEAGELDLDAILDAAAEDALD